MSHSSCSLNSMKGARVLPLCIPRKETSVVVMLFPTGLPENLYVETLCILHNVVLLFRLPLVNSYTRVLPLSLVLFRSSWVRYPVQVADNVGMQTLLNPAHIQDSSGEKKYPRSFTPVSLIAITAL